MPIIRCNEVPARVALASQIAHFVAGVQDRLERGVGFWSQVSDVVVVTEAEVALGSGEEAGS